MIYKFNGQGLFYMASVVCFLSIILIPLGVFFIYAARKAEIRFENGAFVYKMFGEKVIPFTEIRELEILQHVDVRYKVGYVIPTFATVVPMQIIYGNNKKLKFSLNYFEKPAELAEELQKKTGKKLKMPE